jgi:hypothetical protein
MELLNGQTLADAIEQQGRFGFDQVLRVFRPLCHALGAAHAVGVVHRDIKPENVFLATAQSSDRDLNVKVLDFGIAKLVAEAQDSGTANVGTPLWMAPEQTDLRAAIGPAADIWPLGLIAYRMLTGQHYWRSANDPSGSMQSLLREGLIEPIAPASSRAAEQGVHNLLPPGFDEWFARAVHRDPNARFSSAAEALASLERLTTLTPAVALGVTSPARTVSPSSRGTSWIAAGVLGLVALGAVAVAAVGVVLYVFRADIGSGVASTPAATAAPVASAAPPATESAAPVADTPETPEAPAPGKATAARTDKKGDPVQATPTPTPSAAPAKSESGLAPFDRAAATAKVNAAVAQATSSCKSQKGDAAVESYKGSIGFNADGSRSMGFQGPGGARDCVRGIMNAVRIPKYAPDPKDPWRVDVVTFSVTIQ